MNPQNSGPVAFAGPARRGHGNGTRDRGGRPGRGHRRGRHALRPPDGRNRRRRAGGGGGGGGINPAGGAAARQTGSPEVPRGLPRPPPDQPEARPEGPDGPEGGARELGAPPPAGARG